MANPNVQALTDALNQIDAATTQAGSATTAIAARIQKLLDQIAAAPSPEELQALVTQAGTEVSKLQPVADALTAMGQDPANPVPVAVPSA